MKETCLGGFSYQRRIEAMKQIEPNLRCNLIMKGDTVSGALYPKAIQEIMKKYRQVRTSAGAIAAAAAAAAEKGRAAGFEQKLGHDINVRTLSGQG